MISGKAFTEALESRFPGVLDKPARGLTNKSALSLTVPVWPFELHFLLTPEGHAITNWLVVSIMKRPAIILYSSQSKSELEFTESLDYLRSQLHMIQNTIQSVLTH